MKWEFQRKKVEVKINVIPYPQKTESSPFTVNFSECEKDITESRVVLVSC